MKKFVSAAILTLLACTLSFSVFKVFADSGSSMSLISKNTHIESKIHTLFSKWRSIFGKAYHSPMENEFRLKVFAQSIRDMKIYNLSHPSTTFNLSRAADMSDDEFMSLFPTK